MVHLPDLEAAIRNEARQARQDSALLASFEALRLNLGTEDAEVGDCDSRCGLVKEAGLHDETSFDGFAGTADIGG